MTSSIDSLTGMPMPALGAAAAARPNAAAGAAADGTEGSGGASGFERLMHLQQRGRELEAKLAKDAAGASASDPAATALAKQKQFYAKEFQALRELVGPTPGGNARRALAAIVERMEGGGALKPTDRARIRLAIAADEKRVDLSGANAFRHAILAIDSSGDASAAEAQDPTMLQDPARLAKFQERNRAIEDLGTQLLTLTSAARLDSAVAHKLGADAEALAPKQAS
jgi:hypothetical protein